MNSSTYNRIIKCQSFIPANKPFFSKEDYVYVAMRGPVRWDENSTDCIADIVSFDKSEVDCQIYGKCKEEYPYSILFGTIIATLIILFLIYKIIHVKKNQI